MSSEFDFVSEFKRLIGEITDTPEEFAETAALFLISTFAGRKFAIYTAPEIQIFGEEHGGKLLNMWFILIGKTRVSRKSTLIDKVEQYIHEIAPELLLPKEFTSESLISELADKTVSGITHAAWVHDEISQFFEALKKKDYMASTDAVLSRIYDGRDYYRSTISRGKEVVKRPYLTALLASTDVLPTYFTELYIRQGFLNRFVYVVAEKGGLRELKFDLDESVRDELQKLGDEWLKELYLLQNTVIVDLTHEARQRYCEFEKWVDSKILNDELGVKEGFYGNMPNVLLKLASLYRISRVPPDKVGSLGPLLIVDEQDIQRALVFLAKAEKWFDKVVKLMKISPQRRDVVVEEGELEYIMNIIEMHGGKMKLSDLIKEAKMVADRVQRIVDTLVMAGQLRWTRIKHGRGRPAIGVEVVRK